MANTRNRSAKAPSPNDHDPDCPHHGGPRAGLCTALTQTGKECSRRAKAANLDSSPLCRTHQSQKRPTGNCQAVEVCGQLCNRLAPYDAPYHLCKKHQNGTSTLPCHFMRLPTELRLMIFRYLFPEIVRSHQPAVKAAILKVSRQIYEEASSILYGESIFQVYVGPTSITLQGKSWYRQPFVKSKTKDYTMENTLCHTGARLIRNLDVEVSLGRKNKCLKGVNTRGITHEDYELYIMRDSVRKLVEFLSSQYDPSSTDRSVLKRLKVRPIMELNWGWKLKEAMVALFLVLEPFQSLPQVDHPVLEYPTLPSWSTHSSGRKIIARMETSKAYIKLRERWCEAIRASTSAPHAAVDGVVKTGYRRIEAFAQLIYFQDASTTRTWTATIFHGIERPLHLARVAYENNDSDAMNKIHEAIKFRWINAHRQQQESLRAIADSINAMFEKDNAEDECMSPRELYPDAFLFDDIEPIQQDSSPSYLWQELNAEDDAPKTGDPGVTVKEKGVRIRLEKDDMKWVRLMTPAVVRQIQNQKESGIQA